MRFYRCSVAFERICQYPLSEINDNELPTFLPRAVIEKGDYVGAPVQVGHGEAEKLGHIISATWRKSTMTAVIQLWEPPPLWRVSLSWRYNQEPATGTFRGKPYEAIATSLYIRHLALVEKGRLGTSIFEELSALEAVGIASWTAQDARSAGEMGIPTAGPERAPAAA